MEETHPVNRDSIYRIASISKMFTVLETLILRERGALNWDDPVKKFLPEFKPTSSGWSNYLNGLGSKERPHITLRQLASHLASIGRHYPPSETEDWPVSGLPTDEIYFIANISSCASTELGPSYDKLLKLVSKYPLVNVPYGYPIYSNMGMSLLGLSNIAANKMISSHPSNEPQTHKELVKRDIFDPFQMN
ncbi:beta-lactamase/transpeptidase-like protein, partial [Pholiota molesta]